jgi:hypothetical protein
MASRPASIRKADVERAVKGVMATGLAIVRVEFEGTKIVVFTGQREGAESPLDAWRRKNGQG